MHIYEVRFWVLRPWRTGLWDNDIALKRYWNRRRPSPSLALSARFLRCRNRAGEIDTSADLTKFMAQSIECQWSKELYTRIRDRLITADIRRYCSIFFAVVSRDECINHFTTTGLWLKVVWSRSLSKSLSVSSSLILLSLATETENKTCWNMTELFKIFQGLSRVIIDEPFMLDGTMKGSLPGITLWNFGKLGATGISLGIFSNLEPAESADSRCT